MDVAKVNRTDIKKRGKYVRMNKDRVGEIRNLVESYKSPSGPTIPPPSCSLLTIALARSFNSPGLYLTFSQKILEEIKGIIFSIPYF